MFPRFEEKSFHYFYLTVYQQAFSQSSGKFIWAIHFQNIDITLHNIENPWNESAYLWEGCYDSQYVG